MDTQTTWLPISQDMLYNCQHCVAAVHPQAAPTCVAPNSQEHMLLQAQSSKHACPTTHIKHTLNTV
jgi:hypothetical protein